MSSDRSSVSLLRWARRFAAIGVSLLLWGCAEPYGDLKEELKLLTRDMRGRVSPLGPAATLPEAAPPLMMERDPFGARGS